MHKFFKFLIILIIKDIDSLVIEINEGKELFQNISTINLLEARINLLFALKEANATLNYSSIFQDLIKSANSICNNKKINSIISSYKLLNSLLLIY